MVFKENPDIEKWNSGAYAYSSQITRDVFRETILLPVIFRLLDPAPAERVLDAGSGDGYIALRLNELGAAVTALDASKAFIEIAKRSASGKDISFLLADLRHSLPFGDACFDAVLANMVLMDFDPIEGALKDFYRVLKPSGRLVVSILHPAFASNKLAKSLLDIVLRKPPHYRVRHYHTAFSYGRNVGASGFFAPYYHRPLEYYFSALKSAGFSITDLEEPVFKQDFVIGKNGIIKLCAEVPLFLVLRAEKFRK